MKNAAIVVVYTLLFCVYVHAQARVEEHDSQEIAAIVSALVGEMVSIPGGSFRMGDLSGEGSDDEKPVRTVTVPAFRMGKHEVTYAQWDACLADGGCNGYSPHGWWGRGDRPVIDISWDDVQSFIDWLNAVTGGNYRLPSEAEWEYAARAGSTTEYSWGDDIGNNRANCDGCGSQWDNDRTAPVGSFPANAWGVHDMHGNVDEWVHDCRNDGYEGAPTDGSVWTSGDCSQSVVRGGSWHAYPRWLRSAYRNWKDRTNSRHKLLGFRLARSAPAAPSQPSAAAQPQIRSNALHNAAMAGDIEMLKAAITAGVDVNARDGRSRTALMYVVDNGYVLLVSQLLEAQADVDMRAADGATALFMAAANGHTEIIELLMKAGAEVSIRGPKGATPTDVARERYGDANAARATGKPEAVLALLDGKTWMEVEQDLEEARAQVEPRVRQLADEMVSIPAGSFDMGGLSHDSSDDECLVYEEPVNQVMNVSLRSASQTTSISDLEVLFSSYDCYDWPVHRVTVPAFKLGKHEVTVSQFRAFVVATGYRTDAERNAGGEEGCNISNADDDWSWTPGSSWFSPGFVVSDDQPVVCVSWNDAQAFIDWLNGKVGGNYRLPSEAEWEYAARSGTTTKYSWGDDIGQNRAR